MCIIVSPTSKRGGPLTEDALLIGYKELPYQMPEMVRRLLKDTSRGLWWPKDATDRVIPMTNMARDVLQRRVDVAARAGIPWLFADKAAEYRAILALDSDAGEAAHP